MGREALRPFGASLLLLIPCFWSSRMQAGDLGSHIYNAWLVQLIQQGQTQYLTLAHQSTNVLFDLLLSSLFNVLGPGGAQRVAVGICVLTFCWGAWAFISAAARRQAWD